jgi:peptidoglycan-associated lipoprotein
LFDIALKLTCKIGILAGLQQFKVFEFIKKELYMNHLRNLLVISAVAAFAGCASPVDVGTKKEAPIETPATNTTPPAPAATRDVAPVVAPAIDPLNDPKGALAKRSVYFDFDSYVIKGEFQTLLEAHAKYLRDHKDRKVSIEGNADERGSREYNLALGQKRAEAVKKALIQLSVSEAQLEAVSLGEEKPRAAGHDEASWAENRRGDLRYL